MRSEFNWVADPPEVVLSVRADEPVTPRQVALLEEFVEAEVGRPFTLIFQVVQDQEVRRETLAPEEPEVNSPETTFPPDQRE
ncbi:hypothetical protein [Synechococcus sp. H55.10]|uniref:hypothetical protein n=1 Tax=Synechococcus sp. H55.10 TaxID=2964503 RepID=UPI0039C69131